MPESVQGTWKVKDSISLVQGAANRLGSKCYKHSKHICDFPIKLQTTTEVHLKPIQPKFHVADFVNLQMLIEAIEVVSELKREGEELLPAWLLKHHELSFQK